ncbi:M28 family peptidase [Winogradskyella sp. 3972H.M.0a.05]|uniref:M28 family peptidase n=1 Tax=Winogradskyella sp. 3972H.M.0a.05 TaxID=2950277 RepID=UPI00339329A3
MKKILMLLALIVAFGCKKQNATPQNNMEKDVVYLADDKLEGRQTGTEGEILAAKYIGQRFKEMDVAPKGTDGYIQSFNFKPKTDPHKDVEFSKDEDGYISGRNVIGYIDNNAKTTVVIGAHYDHLGHGGDGSLYRGEEKQIHNGADDNASGVAIMLDLANRLKVKNTTADKKDLNNYLFIAFSGEEMGLIGSNYFVKNPTLDIKSINYMINMDMVGRLKQDSTLAVYGVGTSPMFKQVLQSHNNSFKLVQKESGVGPSDQTSFYLNDIPVLHFFTGQHEDYHKPSDDSEKLNYEGMEMISNYLYDIISDLDDNSKLAFRTTKNESEEVPRFKVGLGVIPDYLFDGKGMRIDGVSEDKPAKKAGLQKGDIVIKLGDSAVTDMMSYMKALSIFDEGDTTKVVVDRSGESLEFDLQF